MSCNAALALEQHVAAATAFLQPFYNTTKPTVAIILGSGAADVQHQLTVEHRLSYGEIPHFPQSTVPGHANLWLQGDWGGRAVIGLVGRVHLYEGFSAMQVSFAMRVLARLGVSHVLLTNASGGIRADLEVGDLVLVRDHLNLTGQNPLNGLLRSNDCDSFVDMQHAYHPQLQTIFREQAGYLGLVLKEGVYACLPGPSYETPAEIKMLQVLGADLVGMSTVAEMIVAAQLGLRCAVLSIIANKAAGLSDVKLSHQEVSSNAQRVLSHFTQLLQAVVLQV